MQIILMPLPFPFDLEESIRSGIFISGLTESGKTNLAKNNKKMEEICSNYFKVFLISLMFLVAFSAIDRSTSIGFEGNLCFFTAIRASDIMHLTLPEVTSFIAHSFHLA